MIKFILNNTLLTTDQPGGLPLLDFIRTNNSLKGTKIGCREGDCGACTVLEGSLKNNKLTYRSVVSCLTPLANAHGKHIVTIEGLNLDELNPAQSAIADNSATQCGFCTPGFVVALTGFLMSDIDNNVLNSISGNICRCTGYKSINKAATDVQLAKNDLLKGYEIPAMIDRGWLPNYFSTIEERLGRIDVNKSSGDKFVGGGTDIMVQQPEALRDINVSTRLVNVVDDIIVKDNEIIVDAATKIESFFIDENIAKYYPDLKQYANLVASEQIRNMGTLAGNMVNASPIGDMNITLLALNSKVLTSKGRVINIKDFFIDYKKVALDESELINSIIIPTHNNHTKFHFEKVSKRTYLDIASVNSAILVKVNKGIIEDIELSAGGIAPVPKYLHKTCQYLKGKALNIKLLTSAVSILNSEISPISDIRGSKKYKRLLIRQIFIKHFMSLYPTLFNDDEIAQLLKSTNPVT